MEISLLESYTEFHASIMPLEIQNFMRETLNITFMQIHITAVMLINRETHVTWSNGFNIIQIKKI